MQLVRRHPQLLIYTVEGHPKDCAAPHRKEHPAECRSFRSFERAEYSSEKHHGDDAEAEVFKNVPSLSDQVPNHLIAKSTQTNFAHIQIHSAHPASFRVDHAVEHRIKRDTCRISADRVSPDEPRQINSGESAEHDCARPHARPEKEHTKNKSSNKHPDSKRVSES